MGYSNLLDLASQTDLTTAVSWHLKANCYPPVPDVMIPICVEAIDLAICEEGNQYVELPEGVLYKGDTSAPAWAIVDNYRLGAIIDANLDADDEY
jgi:hypothetical protein